MNEQSGSTSGATGPGHNPTTNPSKHVWTPEQLARVNAANKTNDQKAVIAKLRGDGGTDNLAGEACTAPDGRSGYIIATGEGQYECQVGDNA